MIGTILAQAEKEMIVPYNAASKATPPKPKKKIANHYQPEQVISILNKLEQEPLKWQLITQLLMVTGARRGEIVGLRWSKVDFSKKRILIAPRFFIPPQRASMKTQPKRVTVDMFQFQKRLYPCFVDTAPSSRSCALLGVSVG